MLGKQAVLLIALAVAAPAKTVIFWDDHFPAAETEVPARPVLEQALRTESPVFRSLEEIQRPGALAAGDLLVLPYGSAFPADAWDVIRQQLARGNLLNIGGRALTVPVRREGGEWRAGGQQLAYARLLGIEHTLAAPAEGRFQWDSDTVSFEHTQLQARQVFVLAAEDGGGRRRGIGFLVNSEGDRTAAPVTADDVLGAGRRVFLSFEPAPGYWGSADGVRLLRAAGEYAARGAVRVWIDLANLTLEPGSRASGTIEVQRSAEPTAVVRLELLSGNRVRSTLDLPCGAALHAPFTFPEPLADPGLYGVRATLRVSGRAEEKYTTGFWVRDEGLLHSGTALEAGRDYLRLGGKPYLPVGANYFSTDPYASFFLGGSLGGNAWQWDRDFADIERHGLTFIRTGVWRNRQHYLDPVTGKASERFLRALEAYLHSAARYHMQVNFTFFAFEPQTVEEPGKGQESGRLGPGTNPYTDPVAVDAQLAWVQSIAARFKDVPFLSFDLINEPSYSNPSRLWKGNVPNGDPSELAQWRQWLAHRYASPAALADAWRVPWSDIDSFSSLLLPDIGDLGPMRSGSPRLARAIDYNLFAQDAFRAWAARMVRGLRDAGARQAVTVGQDEGGVTDRVLNQFYGDGGISFTVNHTWWRDDALLWDSLVAKRPDKPNLVGETGPQPVWATDGNWRWDEAAALPLEERKLALGFAAANAGALHWDWARGDTFGLLRSDGSFKPWIRVLAGIADFARAAQPFATEARRPEIAMVLPQSAQLSVANAWAVEAQQKSVRALYQYARQSAYAVGEYQLELVGNPKLIIVPAPWVLQQAAWDKLLAKVRSGATLLVSGRIDADEHWASVPARTAGWAPEYQSGLLATRENVVTWPGGSIRLSYSGEKTTYAERGILSDGSDFTEVRVGEGRILYFALPLEWADELDSIGRIYRYAAEKAGVASAYQTEIDDPGILICPTALPEATLYVFTSETSHTKRVDFRDAASGKQFAFELAPGRAALALIRHDGTITAAYNLKQ